MLFKRIKQDFLVRPRSPYSDDLIIPEKNLEAFEPSPKVKTHHRDTSPLQDNPKTRFDLNFDAKPLPEQKRNLISRFNDDPQPKNLNDKHDHKHHKHYAGSRTSRDKQPIRQHKISKFKQR